MMKRTTLSSLMVFVLLSSGCLTHRPDWVERELPIQSEDVLWQYALSALKTNEFPVGMGADPSERRIESGWRMELQPFRGEGFRERATLKFEPTPTGFLVHARVEREINQDILKPLLPTYAKWERVPDDKARAAHLVQLIESRLGQNLELGQVEAAKVDDVHQPLQRRR